MLKYLRKYNFSLPFHICGSVERDYATTLDSKCKEHLGYYCLCLNKAMTETITANLHVKRQSALKYELNYCAADLSKAY